MTTGQKILCVVGTGSALTLGIFALNDSATTAVKTEMAPSAVLPMLGTNTKAAPVKSPTKTEERTPGKCHPSYSGCLKMNAGDYDCASGSGNGPNYTGKVEVYGSDPFDLDRDNDGWGCEN